MSTCPLVISTVADRSTRLLEGQAGIVEGAKNSRCDSHVVIVTPTLLESCPETKQSPPAWSSLSVQIRWP